MTYTVLQTLKSGGQAEVAFATSDKEDKVYFIKRLLTIKYTEKTKKNCSDFETNQNKLYRQLSKESTEISSCPKILDFFRENTFYYVVTERIVGIPCNTQELYTSLTIQDRLELFKIIVYSFYGLEKSNIVHGDVKPENILLKKVNKHFVSKLIDLESAFFSTMPPARGCIVGTDPYSSPELIDYNDEESELIYKISSKSDIFSLGVILYEFVCGVYPKSSKEGLYAFEISKGVEPLLFDDSISEELKVLIQSMLELNPEKRPNVLNVLSQVKKLTDVSTPLNVFPKPYIVIERVSEDKAYIHLFSLLRDGVVKVSVDGNSEILYKEPILIEDDDIPLETHLEVKSEDGYLALSETLKTEVSVASERNGRVDRPYIDIDDGVVTISTYTSDATIYYTTDGTFPNRKSMIYSGPINLPEYTIVKAIAVKRGMYNSDVASRNTSSRLTMS